MTATTAAPPRILSLDIVRGVAVMGILAMNIVGFSMPFAAYMNPLAYGTESAADFVAWLLSFIFVDGKMRGLFSFLFGASMLLVIERAEAKNESPAAVHFRRMTWLLLFGLLHLYLIWFGDILALYALVGIIAWLFRRKSARALVRTGIMLILLQLMIYGTLAAGTFYLQEAAAAPGAPAELTAQWQGMERTFGVPSPQALADQLALFRGSYWPIVEYRFDHYAFGPLKGLGMLGAETLAYFLFGMAALKTGFLTGAWDRRLYLRIALVGLAIAIPAYVLLAWALVSDGFSVPMLIAVVMAATVPFRPVMVLAYAALIILMARNGGWLAERLAAAGRAAFSNYIGTSIVMTTLFYGYGLGLFGLLGRAELWLAVIGMWTVMLAWSKPWLDRFSYGPLEWLWRSLSRWEVQTIRK